jgi:hypothetical protein
MEVILRCSVGGFEWRMPVVDMPVALPVGLARFRRINDSVLAERSGGMHVITEGSECVRSWAAKE